MLRPEGAQNGVHESLPRDAASRVDTRAPTVMIRISTTARFPRLGVSTDEDLAPGRARG
jgi:hypothetical protein